MKQDNITICSYGPPLPLGYVAGFGWPDGQRGPLYRTTPSWTFLTIDDLVHGSRELAARAPADVDAVAAIPRSGLLPGTILATARHLPLWMVSRQSGVQYAGNGVRAERLAGGGRRHILLIDDTAAWGREIAACRPLVAAAFPGARITTAAVFVRASAIRLVDLFVEVDVSDNLLLEWNWNNAAHVERIGLDFDGILCRDKSDEPLYLFRRHPVPLIVTGRHEQLRGATEAWLARWGVRCERLVMRDFDPPEVYDAGRIAALKAREYVASGLPWFAESDPWQAEEIARLARKPVICPAARRAFPPPPPPPLPDCPHARPNAGTGCLPIRCLDHRGCSCGGSHSDAAHCARCLERGVLTG